MGPSSPSSQSSASSRFAWKSIQDLQDIACDEGYDINGLDRKDLEKTAEWVNSQEYKQQKQKSVQDEISTKFASTSLKDLQATAQTQGYDINGRQKENLHSHSHQSNNRGPQHGHASSSPSSPSSQSSASSRFASTSIQDLQDIACDEGYDINGLDRKDLEKTAEWVNSQEYNQQ